ncbi:hypothetical protein BGZ49_004174 [Haplosporangium sp. Z 27]|nr:hypothetical protein BGZ49_004174 [Haplosporangium sp. Z 27]
MTGVTTFLVGLLYAMPVTTREGIFAVYQPETPFGGKALSPIHVLTPTTTQKNIMLFVGPIYPLFSGVGIGAVAGVYYDRGDMRMYNILMRVQYGNWVAIFYITAATFFYYGLKYTFILRANIILAETALKAPRAAFGIGNIVSRSPARFLFIQLQIMGFGGCAVTSLAGTLCLLWVCLRDKILRMESPRLPHTMSVFWTCAMAIAVLVVSSLTAAQSVKSRKRSMHDPSSSLTHPTELPPKGGSNPSAAAAAAAAVRSGSAGSSSLKHDNLYQNQSLNSKHSKQGVARSDAEACLTRGSSGDISSLHSVSYEKHSFDMIGEGLAMHDLENNLEDVNESSYYYQTTSLTPPPRPLAIPGLGQRAGGLSLQSPPVDENHSQLRESVFGGRTPREETSRVTASPPQSPTSGSYGNGYNLPIFPKSSLRSNSKSASGVFARSSIGSNAPFNSGSVSTPTTASPSRQSRGSSKYWPSSPTTPVQNSSQQSSYDQSMSASPPPQYSPTRKSNSQPVSQSGGGVRKQSNAGLWPNNFTNTADIGPTSQSAPIPVSSRGGRVEYESQGIELEPVNNSIQSSVEANYY